MKTTEKVAHTSFRTPDCTGFTNGPLVNIIRVFEIRYQPLLTGDGNIAAVTKWNSGRISCFKVVSFELCPDMMYMGPRDNFKPYLD